MPVENVFKELMEDVNTGGIVPVKTSAISMAIQLTAYSDLAWAVEELMRVTPGFDDDEVNRLTDARCVMIGDIAEEIDPGNLSRRNVFRSPDVAKRRIDNCKRRA